MDSAAPWHAESSHSRDQTPVLRIGRRILNHWTTKEVLCRSFNFFLITFCDFLGDEGLDILKMGFLYFYMVHIFDTRITGTNFLNFLFFQIDEIQSNMKNKNSNPTNQTVATFSVLLLVPVCLRLLVVGAARGTVRHVEMVGDSLPTQSPRVDRLI